MIPEHKFRGKVNHVGFILEIINLYTHLQAKKKVIITSFNEKPFYKRRFLRGERVVNSSSAYASLLPSRYSRGYISNLYLNGLKAHIIGL